MGGHNGSCTYWHRVALLTDDHRLQGGEGGGGVRHLRNQGEAGRVGTAEGDARATKVEVDKRTYKRANGVGRQHGMAWRGNDEAGEAHLIRKRQPIADIWANEVLYTPK